MIAVVDVAVQAANVSMPLFPWRAFRNSYSSVRVRNVPRKIGKWNITNVAVQVTYPDGSIKTADAVLTGGVWVATVEGTAIAGTSLQGYKILASGIDENGQPVSNYCLGRGDVTILEDDGELIPKNVTTYTRLLSSEPANPKDGDLYQISGSWYIYQDSQAWPIGDDSGMISELSAELSTKQDKLTDIQLSSIDYVANEQMTTIKFIDGTSEKVEIVGEINQVTLDPFFGRGMTDIKIGTLVNVIGNDAFDNFSDLSNVFIPETVRIIDDYAFLNAPALSTLTIPNSVSSIGIAAFHENLTVTFIGKTMNEVSSMANYSWGLNASNIKTWNAASQEDLSKYALSADVQNALGDIETILNAL